MSKPIKRYRVCAGRPYTTRDGQNKKQWIEVGRGTEWDDGSINMEMHTAPVGGWFDGKLSFFPADEQRNAAQRNEAPPPPAGADFSDDDIPFN